MVGYIGIRWLVNHAYGNISSIITTPKIQEKKLKQMMTDQANDIIVAMSFLKFKNIMEDKEAMEIFKSKFQELQDVKKALRETVNFYNEKHDKEIYIPMDKEVLFQANQIPKIKEEYKKYLRSKYTFRLGITTIWRV